MSPSGLAMSGAEREVYSRQINILLQFTPLRDSFMPCAALAYITSRVYLCSASVFACDIPTLYLSYVWFTILCWDCNER